MNQEITVLCYLGLWTKGPEGQFKELKKAASEEQD